LIERAGDVVGKDELIARVWPQTFVEEANLKIQSVPCRALGDGQGGNRYIVTVVGRGYNFVAQYESTAIADPAGCDALGREAQPAARGDADSSAASKPSRHLSRDCRDSG